MRGFAPMRHYSIGQCRAHSRNGLAWRGPNALQDAGGAVGRIRRLGRPECTNITGSNVFFLQRTASENQHSDG
ncbi:unnamed protein product [Mycetohabitans rhizoxinica HKI 454]|uniref:Uncharacterized protein n=1 Tax=Mycetohabitans rhizoxinica (strain DSM 19002 / CIP 109453 / HKI 454) TaxID=882378 RepID=E5ALR9_MYCRK|nr:unnamed protein product [Mycetohabitans rhizoxinica HKI 454]